MKIEQQGVFALAAYAQSIRRHLKRVNRKPAAMHFVHIKANGVLRGARWRPESRHYTLTVLDFHVPYGCESLKVSMPRLS